MMLLPTPTIGSSLRQHRRFLSSLCSCRARNFASNDHSAQLDEEEHLGKQLSPPSENTRLRHSKWTNIARTKFPTIQTAAEPVGLHHYTYNPYEHEGLAEIHERSYDANVLLEIRDVRVPASSHHPSFTRLARHRTHLICYTHADLIDAPTRDRVADWTGGVWPDARCLFVDTRAEGQRPDTDRFAGLYDGLLRQIDDRGGSRSVALTVGIPNVGKSSVLQSLLRLARRRGTVPKQIKVKAQEQRKRRVPGAKGKGSRRLRKAGMPGIIDTPGKTREITEYLLREKPRAYFMDVPGITPPDFFFAERPAAWLGCGAVNLLPLGRPAADDAIMHRSFCAYVLACANRDRVFHYVDKLGLAGPTDDVDAVLATLANGRRDQNLNDEARELRRCAMFLKLYNTGNLGPLVLDDVRDATAWQPFVFRDEHFAQREERRRDRRGLGDDDMSPEKPPQKRHGREERFARGPEEDGPGAEGRRREHHGNERSAQRPNRGDPSRADRRNDDRSNDDDEWFRTP